jgi:site-specific recombinase XerD
VIPLLPTDSPLAELAAAFTRSLRSRRKSPATIEVYVRAILEFDRYAAAQGFPREADKVRRAHLEAFIEDQGTRLAPATASVRYTALGVFFKWLLEEQEIQLHPFAGMEHPSVPDTMPKVISDDQVVALLKAADGPSFRQRRDRAVLGVLVDTGCRRAEVATMTLDAIDLDQQTIRVTGKGSKTRTVFSKGRRSSRSWTPSTPRCRATCSCGTTGRRSRRRACARPIPSVIRQPRRDGCASAWRLTPSPSSTRRGRKRGTSSSLRLNAS